MGADTEMYDVVFQIVHFVDPFLFARENFRLHEKCRLDSLQIKGALITLPAPKLFTSSVTCVVIKVIL